jgi:ribosomal protein S18 acetylase RimI-like enzyme
MINVEIKKIALQDLDALQKISKETFQESFAAENTAENMAKYVEEGFSAEKLGKEILEQNSAFYVVTVGKELLGYLKINLGNAQTELKEVDGLEIERIYVLRAQQGKGIGNLLFEKAMAIAKENKLRYIWLGVWEKNTGAIEFYKQKGMEIFDSHVFRLGDEEQLDYLMRLPLRLSD